VNNSVLNSVIGNGNNLNNSLGNGVAGTGNSVANAALNGISGWGNSVNGNHGLAAGNTVQGSFNKVANSSLNFVSGVNNNVAGALTGGSNNPSLANIVVGTNNKVTQGGDLNTMFGRNNTVIGTARNAVIAGNGNVASGNRATVIGQNSYAQGRSGIAIGDRAAAWSFGTTAMGMRAQAIGPYSTAIGAGSVALAPNTVSMGNAWNPRRVTNVDDPVNPTDAVNLRTLDKVRDEARKGIAISEAMETFLPDPDKRYRITAGAGYFKGEGALGVTGSGFVDEQGTALYFGVGAADSGTWSAKAGVSWQFD
jgi:hypothetical protein